MRKEQAKKNYIYVIQREPERNCTGGCNGQRLLRSGEGDVANEVLLDLWIAGGWKGWVEEAVG